MHTDQPWDGHDDSSEYLFTIGRSAAPYTTADATRLRQSPLPARRRPQRTKSVAADIPTEAAARRRRRSTAATARRGQGGLIMRFAFYGRGSTEYIRTRRPGDVHCAPRDQLVIRAISERIAWHAEYSRAMLAAGPPGPETSATAITAAEAA